MPQRLLNRLRIVRTASRCTGSLMRGTSTPQTALENIDGSSVMEYDCEHSAGSYVDRDLVRLTRNAERVELSVVMPCLNEKETVGVCVQKAIAAFKEAGIAGEVIVADNGSTDGSAELAESEGARVVRVSEKGYGHALKGGILASRGAYVLMADSDDSYDFSHAPRFLEALRAGSDLVMGNRFRGGIRRRAMPFLHRYLGNPVLSGIGRLFFKSPCGDFHCGIRAVRKDCFERMDIRSTGMEFASEMVVESQSAAHENQRGANDAESGRAHPAAASANLA